MFRSMSRLSAAALVATTSWISSAAAQEPAGPAVLLNGRYIADIIQVAQGEGKAQTFVVHDAELVAELDLERLIGASGLSAGTHLLATA